VYVVSGAVFDSGHATIGDGVAVPTRLYKVIVYRQSGQVSAYLMPNAAISVRDLPQYKTTVAEVEQATGLRFPVE
jgi:DNA/RNA endonuclease G (NUC1)